jgi:acyl-coenzyme A synthetase/AMP-(fatty) acid ligase
MFLDIDRKDSRRFAAIDEQRITLTYGALTDFCKALSNYLPTRSLLFQFCENTLGSLCGYIGAVSIGAVPLLLAADIEAEHRDKLIKIYSPSYVWAPLAMYTSFGIPMFTAYDYGLFRLHETSITLHPSLALLLTTSGSTGSPKLVRQSAQNVRSNAEANYIIFGNYRKRASDYNASDELYLWTVGYQ